MLASEYGWDLDRILYRVTVPELLRLIDKINLRTVRRNIADLAISQNPHTKNPKELADSLIHQEKELLAQISNEQPKPPEFDAVGFELLKQRMSQNPRIIVK